MSLVALAKVVVALLRNCWLSLSFALDLAYLLQCLLHVYAFAIRTSALLVQPGFIVVDAHVVCFDCAKLNLR